MIDQVAIRMSGGFNLLSPSAWQALPKDERMALIRAGRVEFLEDGESVPLRSALTALRSAFAPVAA